MKLVYEQHRCEHLGHRGRCPCNDTGELWVDVGEGERISLGWWCWVHGEPILRSGRLPRMMAGVTGIDRVMPRLYPGSEIQVAEIMSRLVTPDVLARLERIQNG